MLCKFRFTQRWSPFKGVRSTTDRLHPRLMAICFKHSNLTCVIAYCFLPCAVITGRVVFPHSQCVYELPQLWVLSSQHSVCQTVGGLIDTAHAYWEKLLDSVGKAAVMSYRHSMWKRATLKEPNKTPPREREPTSMCKMECIEDGI